MGNNHLITALAIDHDPLSCATHELSHPHIPVVKYEMGEWEDTLALIHRYVPKVLMSKTYIYVSAAFVKRILLEEGAPRIIRCDNDSEFKNKTMNELRLLMRSELQFSPAY